MRAVKTSPTAPATNLEAAQSGNRRQALEMLRDTLAKQLDDTTAQIHAQLAAQYRATLSDLAELASPAGRTASERLADRVATANLAS